MSLRWQLLITSAEPMFCYLIHGLNSRTLDDNHHHSYRSHDRAGSLRCWTISLKYLGWKLENSFMRSVLRSTRLGGAHPSPRQTIADVLQLEESSWPQTRGRWLHSEAFRPAMPCHHRTDCIHTYKARYKPRLNGLWPYKNASPLGLVIGNYWEKTF